MGRYTGPKNKIARRFGVNLGLKSNSTKVARRIKQRPGVHGQRRRRGLSSFGKQLEEKQKAKFMYGIRERQFRRYVEEANRQQGDSGVNLQQILETRLDNVVYRLGFAKTRAQARQLVSHNMFTVNGKKLNIPSHLVQAGDEIALKESKKKKTLFADITETLENTQVPSWLSLDPMAASGKVLHLPMDEDFDKVFDVKQIIEYYSSR